MRTIRLYTPFDDFLPGDTLCITGNVHHHVLHVLRLTPGTVVVLFNGNGLAYHAEIIHLDKKSMKVKSQALAPSIPEPSTPVHLAQGLCKGERMDWVVQKATELGVTAITPLLSARVQRTGGSHFFDKKYQHLQQVMIAACEQCGRDTLPVLNQPMALMDFLKSIIEPQRYVLAPSADATWSALSPDTGICVMVGPEGGFDANELQQMTDHGVAPVTLGPRILRTETAALAALATVNALLTR